MGGTGTYESQVHVPGFDKNADIDHVEAYAEPERLKLTSRQNEPEASQRNPAALRESVAPPTGLEPVPPASEAGALSD